MDKFQYLLMDPLQGPKKIFKALLGQAPIVLWEANRSLKFESSDYKIISNEQSSLPLEISYSGADFPTRWKYTSLLFHLKGQELSFFGKLLVEFKKDSFYLSLGPRFYQLERRRYPRFQISKNKECYFRIKFQSPPHYMGSQQMGERTLLWHDFIDFVKTLPTFKQEAQEVFLNYSLIDLSVQGAAFYIPVVEEPYWKSLTLLTHQIELFIEKEKIDISKAEIKYIKEVTNIPGGQDPISEGDFLIIGVSFADDIWVRKLLEIKLKSYFEELEQGFDKNQLP